MSNGSMVGRESAQQSVPPFIEADDFGLEPLSDEQVSRAIDTFARQYTTHTAGYFILGPSGVGKSYYVSNQREPHWIDGDGLWIAAGAHPPRAWWLESLETMIEIDRRSDGVTRQAKQRGLWIIGASNFDITPDAVVVPAWEEHVEMIRRRETTNYTGGATTDRLDQVMGHRSWILERANQEGIQVFESVGSAALHLAEQYTYNY